MTVRRVKASEQTAPPGLFDGHEVSEARNAPAQPPAVPVKALEEKVLAEEKAHPAATADTRAAVAAVLRVPKGKSSLPTLVTYKAAGTILDRHMVIDIGDSTLEEAWKTYRAKTPDATAEGFLELVYDITKVEVPRMYRAVGVLTLK